MNDHYICQPCAKERQAKWPKDHLATFHHGECFECKKNTSICAISDWNWPRDDENKELEKNREI